MRIASIVCVAMTVALISIIPLPADSSLVDDSLIDDISWTVVVYMAADAYPELPWEDDVNEMEGASLHDQINVIILVDPLGDNNSVILELAEDEPWNGAIVSPILADDGTVMPTGEADMASPTVLSNFIIYASNEFPSDRLVLVIWGHGGGWFGICPDGSSVMSIADLGDALHQATGELGRRLDMIITDTCVEGVMETMFEVRDCADIYVGSEKLVPATGFRYDHALDSLTDDPAQTPAEWGMSIVDDYVSSSFFSDGSVELGVFDLNEIELLVQRMDRFSRQAVIYDSLYGNDLLSAILSAQSSDYDGWYKDIGDLFSRIQQAPLPIELRALASEVLRAYDDFVMCSQSHSSMLDESEANFTGAAVYIPADDVLDYGYNDLDFSMTNWDEMCIAALYTGDVQDNDAPSPSVDYVETDGMLSTAIIEWDGVFEYYEAWVFINTTNGLEMWDIIGSEEPSIVINSLGGELTISTWAGSQMHAEAHYTVLALMQCTITLNVVLASMNGPPPSEVDVVAITEKGEFDLTNTGDGYALEMIVPDDASIGDLITIEVRDRMTGALIGSNKTLVGTNRPVTEVLVWSAPSTGLGMQFYLPAGALVVIAITLMMVAASSRRKKNGL